MTGMGMYWKLILLTAAGTIVTGVICYLLSIPGPTFMEMLILVFAMLWCDEQDRQRRLGK